MLRVSPRSSCNRGGACALQLGSVARMEDRARIGGGNRRRIFVRWYWWRVNAWSEISAMMAALVTTLALHSNAPCMAIAGRPQPFSGRTPSFLRRRHLHHRCHHTCVGDGHTAYARGTGRHAREVLPESAPANHGWHAVAKLAGMSPSRATGEESSVLDPGVRTHLFLVFCIGELCFGRYQGGLFSRL